MNKLADLYFRDQFRLSRAVAFRDGEAFQVILLCLERLGLVLSGEPRGLFGYQRNIEEVARRSPLADFIPGKHKNWHIPFSELYRHVREARNEAIHEGAVARHLTEYALKLLLVLEDAIMVNKTKIRDFMVRDPVTASPWQPISFVREQMLTNGFSFVPIYLFAESGSYWGLISEYAIAKYLRNDTNSNERKKRLATTVNQAIDSNELEIIRAAIYSPSDSIYDVLPKLKNIAILLHDASHPDKLLGIVTAFDFM